MTPRESIKYEYQWIEVIVEDLLDILKREDKRHQMDEHLTFFSRDRVEQALALLEEALSPEEDYYG